MKNNLAFIIGALVLVAGGMYVYSGVKERAERAEMWRDIQEARVDTARQIPILIQAPDDKIGYDRQQFIRKHLDAIEAAYKAHPDVKPKDDDYINGVEEQAKEGKKDKAKAAEKREQYDFVKHIWNDYLKTGSYKPVLSAYDHGMRMDILNMKPQGNGFKMEVLFWGPVKDQFNAGPLEIKSAIEVEDPKHPGGKPKLGVVKVDGTATPYFLVDRPWQWIPEWPPGVMVGWYQDLPLFHPKAEKYTWTMGFTLRDQGGTTVPVELKWKDLPVEPSVKGAPGSSWDAPVEAVDDEQLKQEFGDDDKKADDKDGKKNEKKK